MHQVSRVKVKEEEALELAREVAGSRVWPAADLLRRLLTAFKGDSSSLRIIPALWKQKPFHAEATDVSDS